MGTKRHRNMHAAFFLFAVLLISLTIAMSSAATPSSPACPITTNPYNTQWLPINIIVIMLSFAVIAVIYILSNVMPVSMSAKLKALVHTEINQNLVSVLIILVLLGSTIMVTEFTAQLGSTSTFHCNPFAASDFYVGNLTFNTGLKLLNNIYATSIGYAIDARLYTGIGQNVYSSVVAPNVASYIAKTFLNFGIFSITPVFAGDLGISYAIMSDLLTGVFTPIMMIAMGSMFLQYLLIPFIKGAAFLIILPIALIMRSFTFTGAGLRTAANSVLALAVAMYIIYPTMVAYNPMIISWIFTPCPNATNWCNPSFLYLGTAYAIPNIPASTFFTQTSAQQGTVSLSGISITSLSMGEYAQILSAAIDPATVIGNVLGMADQVAQFLFTSVLLFALDMTVTMGFGVGLAKALTSGLDGASAFWSNV